VDLRRLRAGEWLAAAGGVALVVSLLLPWYSPLLPIVPYDSLTGFQALSVIDVLLVLAALVGVALAVLQVTRDSPTAPVAAGILSVVAGLLATLLVVFRLVDSPRPDDELESMYGAWLALVAAAALTAGGWLSLANEHVRGLPPDVEPELRPSPRIADRAQP
jgi:drug/metabolite transporter (DMT)-like permease